MRLAFFVSTLLFLPLLALAGVEITEVMYDLEGSDSGREWIEIFNNSEEEVDLTDWKLYENDTNHKLSRSDLDSLIIPVGGYAVIADDPDKFLIDYSDFSGFVFDSAFSLKNSGEEIIIRDADLNDVDIVFYDSELGASGDGNSLQKIDGEWAASTPSPGLKGQEAGVDEGVGSSSDTDDLTFEPNRLLNFNPNPIKAYAGEDKTIVAGALSEFRGQGFGFGDEPLKNARYLWNFGDGTLKEGQNITHFYRYPGEYSVVLDVSDLGYSVSDKTAVKVISNKIFISEIKTGVSSFVELHNPSEEEINISGWKFRSGNQRFTFSRNSFIRPRGYLVIPATSSGIIFPQGKGLVEFLYPNNSSADSLKYDGVLSAGQSFSREKEDNSVITKETPGLENGEEILLVKPVIQEPIKSIEKSVSVESEVFQLEDFSAEDFEEQGANIITVVDMENDSGKTNRKLYYFLIALGLAIFVGVGVRLIRRKSGV